MKYQMYVHTKIVHECDGWYEGHKVFTDSYGCKKCCWLPISVSIDGGPQWGNTPAQMKDKDHVRKLRSNRTKYLNKVPLSTEELDRIPRQKLASCMKASHEY